MRHKRLLRQVGRTLGVASEQALDDKLAAMRTRGESELANSIAALLAAVDRSYQAYERDLLVRTRMLDISSEELLGANAQLRAEAARQREVLQSLQASAQRLTFDHANAAPPEPVGETDLLGLTQALEQLVRQRETAGRLTEQILDQLPIPVFLKDRDGRFLRFNRKFHEFSRLSRDDMLGARIEDFTRPGWAEQTREEDAQAWASGRMVTSERRLLNVDPPIDVVVNRVVITSGGEAYLLGFVIDVSEQRAARDAMQRAVESAQAASRAKSDFLANMSHEIRTPMNGILGMTELVLESTLLPEQREDIELVKGSADALLTIINDILDFSKIEAGKLDIEEIPFDLEKLVRESVRTLALRAQQKGLALEVVLPPHLPQTMKGDPGRLRQVLLNLLGNAIKFTGQGGVTVSVLAGQENGERCEVQFIVSDTGIGIAPDKQKLIFEAFSQVDGSTTRQYGGTGLGLTICRRLAILMQGEISVSSTPGVGSEFRFTVPLRQSAVPLAPAPQWKLGSPLAAPLATMPPARPAAPASGGLHILLAEDNPVNQRLALRLLEKMGHRVSIVDNGIDAIEAGKGGGFDLLLMDVQMPELDGLSATRAIRQWELEHGGHLPIVAMTARAMQGDRESCLEAGMDEYLSKPVDAEQLRQVVRRFDASPAPVLAWEAALQRLDGDSELLLELAGLFVDDGAAMVAELERAVVDGDVAAAQRAVHSLQGVLANFGAERAMALAQAMAVSLHDAGRVGEWLALGAELGRAVVKVQVALRGKLAQ